jgi:hypothetical protein
LGGVAYAIQDAVAAVLTRPLKAGRVRTRHRARAQRRRAWPTRAIQRFRVILQRMISRAISDAGTPLPSAVVRWFFRIRYVNSLPARLIHFGVRRVHIPPGACLSAPKRSHVAPSRTPRAAPVRNSPDPRTDRRPAGTDFTL